MKKTVSILLCLTFLLLSGCSLPAPVPEETVTEDSTSAELSEESRPEPQPEPGPISEPESVPEEAPIPEDVLSPAEEVLSRMSLSDKLWQLLFVYPEALTEEDGPVLSAGQIPADSLPHTPGGIILFGANVSDPEQLLSLTSGLHAFGNIHPLLAIDEEGGLVARIGSNENFDVPHYENMESIGLTGDPSQAEEAGFSIGTYLKEYGLDLDFAPVADVNTNPDNIVIGSRSFGSNPVSVGEMVSHFVAGMHEAGILTCLKHFPGHGDTTSDTHTGAVVLEKTWEELTACELIPFRAAMEQTDFIMTAHICLPLVDPDGLPSTLSHAVLTEKLRGELGYQGLIVTDALEMGAISQNFTSGEAAVKAIQAGADVLLMPPNAEEAVSALLGAVYSGEISEERINESVLRLLEVKQKQGLLGE